MVCHKIVEEFECQRIFQAVDHGIDSTLIFEIHHFSSLLIVYWFWLMWNIDGNAKFYRNDCQHDELIIVVKNVKFHIYYLVSCLDSLDIVTVSKIAAGSQVKPPRFASSKRSINQVKKSSHAYQVTNLLLENRGAHHL